MRTPPTHIITLDEQLTLLCTNHLIAKMEEQTQTWSLLVKQEIYGLREKV